jgi:site-specific recombinase XerD
MKTSLWFFPNPQKKSAKTGKLPLYVRVILNGKKSEGRLYHADLSQKEALLWNEQTMRLSDSKHKANKLINAVQQAFDEFIILNAKNINRYSASSIRDYLLGRNKLEEPTVVSYIDNFFASTIEKNDNLAAGTKRTYVKAIRHLKNFLRQTKREKLLVRDLSPTIAGEFKDYLLCEKADGETKGMTEPSALGNVKKLRTIFDRAIVDGLLEKNPFKTFKLKARSPQKPRLTVSHVKALLELDLTKYPRLIPYRDLFLFSCFTGLAYEDAHNLTYSDLLSVGKSDIKIHLSREKTDILTEVVLVAQAKKFIEQYKKEKENQITRRVLPQRSNQKINDNLKILSNLIEVPFELKSHTGRRTFRQLLGEAGITDMAVIKRMMGHNRRGDIDEVYYSVTEATLVTAKEKFEAYLEQHLTAC